jgi:hypothetical protein
MKFDKYDEWVKSIWKDWPEKHAWVYRGPNQWEHLGHYDKDLKSFDGNYGGGNLGWNYGRALFNDGSGGFLNVWFTPSESLDPHQWRVTAYPAEAQAPAQNPARGQSKQPAVNPARGQSKQPVVNPARGQPVANPRRQPVASPRQPVANPQRYSAGAALRPYHGRAWQMRGNPAHAYLGQRDLGLLVNDHQVVQPTNNGRLWALYNIDPAGKLSFVNRYGSVPGAPPPPNAHMNGQPEQYQPPPPSQEVLPLPAPPPQPYPVADPMFPTVYDPAYYAEPAPVVYVEPQPVVYEQPAYYYAPPPQPAYYYAPPPQPAYYYAPQQPAQQEIDPATAAFLGAQYGIEQALSSLEGQVQVEYGDYGGYGGYGGGMLESYDPMAVYAGYGLD